MSIRSFIAFPLSIDFEQKLKPVMESLQETNADVRWVKLENLHLTLKFLGTQEEEVLKDISSALKERCRDFKPINASFNEMGAFPDLDHPKIIWGALDDAYGEIEQIARVVDEEIARFGIAQENRSFKAHITFGRVKSYKNFNRLIGAIEGIDLKCPPREILDRIILYKSILHPEGTTYEILDFIK